MKNSNLNLKNITFKEKRNLVKNVFTEVSKSYDFMNDLMSFGLHRLWKIQFCNFIDYSSKKKILDLAAGSGDLTKIICENFNNCDVTLTDSNENMLEEAKKKLSKYELNFIQSFAENLPFKKNIFDYIICAFGMRNFADMDKALSEIHRTLKTKGKFLCLEFSKPNNMPFQMAFKIYGKIIPKMGKIFANNENAYKYLIESIKSFPDQENFSNILQKHKFKNIECYDILSGIASIHIGEK